MICVFVGWFVISFFAQKDLVVLEEVEESKIEG
jgi:hypothetical protein